MEMDGYLDEMFDLKPIMLPDPNPSSSVACNIGSKLLSFENSKTPEISRPYKNPNLGYTNDMMVKPQIINFSSLVEDEFGSDPYNYDMEIASNEIINGHKRAMAVNRTPLQAQDHVMAERKRRQKLGQLFINLSKVVPGLKKLDKASLLEDAIDHLKTLQQQVHTLEEEKAKRSTTSSPIDPLTIDDEDDDIGGISSESSAPEIKAMISKNNVLIKIHCKNQKGLMSRIPWEMEKMHLSVKDIRIMPFGGVTLVITILAEIQHEFRGTVTNIIEQLEMVFLNQTA